MLHDTVERLKIRRHGLALQAGLDPSYNVGTYPPHPSAPPAVEAEAERATRSRLPGLVKTGLVLAATAGLGAAGGVAVKAFLDRLPETVVEERVWDFEIDSEVIPPGQSNGFPTPERSSRREL